MDEPTTEPEGLEDEASRAAMEHMAQMERAEKFSPDALDPFAPEPEEDEPPPVLGRPKLEYKGPGGGGPARLIGLPQRAQDVQHTLGAPPTAPLPKDLRTIEDIYAVYKVGDGETFMRVEREQPPKWRGVSTAGFVGDVYERISMDEFSARFGGNQYKIHVIGPAPGRFNGDAPMRTLTSVTLKVPGPPVVEGSAEDYPMPPGMTRPAYPFPGQVPIPPPAIDKDVAIRQMEIEERREARLDEERRQYLGAARPPQEVLEAATRAAQSAVEIARVSADEKVQILREQNQALIESMSRRDEEIRNLREKLITSERNAAEARQFTETEQIKRLTENHSLAIQRIQDEHAREMNRILQDSRDKLSEETRRHVEERSRFESSSLVERQRLQEDAERRARDQREQFELLRMQSKEQYEARIADLERRTADQIESLRNQHARELESIRTSERASANVTEKTSGFQVSHYQSRVVELQGECDRLRRENEDLRRSAHKDPVTLLTETESIARNLLGMVKPEEVEKEEAPATKDDTWKATGAALLKGLMDGAPKIVEQVQAMRQQNQAAAQQQAMRQQQAMMQQGGPPRALGPAAPPGPPRMMAPPPGPAPRGLMAPTPSWAAVPPPPGAAVGMPPPYTGPVAATPMGYVDRPQNVVSGLPNGPAGVPVTGHVVVAAEGSPVQAQSAKEAAAVAAAPPVQAPPQRAPVELTQEQVVQFIAALNDHIGEGTPVEMFALGFVNQVGRDVAGDLVTRVDPASFLQTLVASNAEGSSYILTANGREYVHKLWAEVRKVVAS